MGQPKYVVVLGTSYCGSTLFACLAATIPNVASVGELHWVVDNRDPRRQHTLCARCSHIQPRACPVDWNSLAPGPEEGLYDRALEYFGVDTLITTDKNARTVQRFVKPREAVGIILWKTPPEALASYKRHNESESAFVGCYPQLLDWATRYCSEVYSLEYINLAKRPWETMAEVCDVIGLEPPQPTKLGDIDYHVVLGNGGTLTSDEVKYDDRWRRDLTPEEIQRSLREAKPITDRLRMIDILDKPDRVVYD